MATILIAEARFYAHLNDMLLARIKAAGITHVVLGTSFKAEVFEEYFGDGEELGLEIEYVVEDKPLGTGGGIRNVYERDVPAMLSEDVGDAVAHGPGADDGRTSHVRYSLAHRAVRAIAAASATVAKRPPSGPNDPPVSHAGPSGS